MEETKKKKVLVVEDEKSLREALVIEFTKTGFIVFEAKDGEEGLEVAFKEHPDIILLDVLMPKMDGIEMFNRLCKDEWGIGVPVIMLTNISDSKTIVSNVRDGISDYLVKSEYKLEDIVKKVKERLNM